MRKFADAFKAKYPKLHLLLNNAGVMALPWRRTSDGNELQMQSNHFSHWLLTGLLLEPLKAAAPSRIVNHSSSLHEKAKGIRCALNHPPLRARPPHLLWRADGRCLCPRASSCSR